MPVHLETDIAWLNVAGGRPLTPEPPGLALFTAPRKAARGRERDTLFLCLGLRTRASTELQGDLQAELLRLAATTFFGTPGSVTAAARQALVAVNQKLLESNLREGAPVQGGLICAALRGADFYVVQCGPGVVAVTHTTTVERFSATASRPLGLSDVLDPQYFHTTLGVGDYFALSQTALWPEAALAGLGGLATLSAVAERLKDTAGGDFTALVARLEPEGTLDTTPPAAPGPAAPTPALSIPTLASMAERLRLPLRPEPPSSASQAESPAPEATRPGSTPAAPVSEAAAPAEPASQLPGAPEAAPLSEAAAAAESSPPEPAGTDWQDLLRRTERWRAEDAPRKSTSAASSTAEAAPIGAPEADDFEAPEPFQRAPTSRLPLDLGALAERAQFGLRSFGRAVGVTLTEATRSTRKLIARALPEGTLQKDGLFTVPTSVQIGIAVLMPLLVVAIVALIYVQRGQAEQFAEALKQAQIEVTKGRIAPDPLAARPNWEAALTWTAQADRLRPGDPSIAQLRQEAQGKLDELDGTTRINYQPLIPAGLGANVQLKRLVLAGRDVYALDTSQNRVWRLTPNTSGIYVVDESFQCASGGLGPLTIGPLIDIGFLPGPNVRDTDTVVALDSAGGLIYCAPGEAPLGSYLTAPPAGWIQPIALALYADRLYILDVGVNQLWVYQASGGAFNQPPTSYFTDVVYDLKDVADFTITIPDGDLTLLRKDGRITTCNRQQGMARCTEAAQFSDPRPGRTSGDRLADLTTPVAILYDQPLEPSYFVLNAANAGLYQLSQRLLFTRQFQPAAPLPAPITAFAVRPDLQKEFFVAAGDRIYRGLKP